MNIEFPKPPAEELSGNRAPPRKKAKIALEALQTKKSVLIINDDNDIYSGDDQSIPTFTSAFKDLGYDIKLEKSGETVYTTWKKYDVVVWSCGDDYSAVNTAKYRQMLVDYIDKGGCILLESGNVAAWAKEFGGEIVLNRMFRETVLHATGDWVYHDVGDLKLKNDHPIATTPNALPETIDFTPTKPGDDSGDANALRIQDDATGIYNWSSVAYDNILVRNSIAENSYGLIAYESDKENGGRIVYFAFDIDDIESPEIQNKLIQNCADWLMGGKKIGDEGMHIRICSTRKVPDRIFPADFNLDRMRSIIVIDKMWVSGTVLHYCFLNQPSKFKGTEEQKKVVRDGFNMWKNLGLGVKFEEVLNPDDAQVRISFLADDGFWSYVGRDILNEEYTKQSEGRTMNFDQYLMRQPRPIDVTTHEIGHTLGLPHEHQNPNSGIKWNEDAVYEWASRTQGWDKAKTDWNIINKIKPDEVRGSNWDPNSIMHYAFEPGLIIEPKKYQKGLTPAGGLSEWDTVWVKTYYPIIDQEDYEELTIETPIHLSLRPKEQKDFLFVPKETRTYEMGTEGESDTVMVLFEENNKKRKQLIANDDSAEDFNSHISFELTKGKRYVLSIRLYSEWEGSTTVKVW
jgi:Matrixin